MKYKMPKRPYSDDDIEPIKKVRKIRSSSSERTLQLLYHGVSKRGKQTEKNESPKMVCCHCSAAISSKMICNYCERDICSQCTSFCYKCKDGFCTNCSFPTYDHNEAVCYSCYV